MLEVEVNRKLAMVARPGAESKEALNLVILAAFVDLSASSPWSLCLAPAHSPFRGSSLRLLVDNRDRQNLILSLKHSERLASS